MRTKIFLSFILIISLALLSNIVFERLILGDFDDFLRGEEEDHIYWIMASVEGSFKENKWDRVELSEAFHWGVMLGFDMYVEDISGSNVLSSSEVLSTLNPNMLNRMNALFELPNSTDEYTWYPLYIKGDEIGKLYIKPLKRLGLIPAKKEVFRKRGREFLIISFLIAGSGALFLSVIFTIFLSNPLRRLTTQAEKIAKGDFSTQETKPNRSSFFHTKDEIDRLTETFQYMAEALRREDSLRKHLTSNITHELRTPLTIIKGNLEAIEDGVISDPQIIIKNINSEIQRIISLVEGIEDITRAEASFFKKGNLEEIDLKEFVKSAISSMEKMITEKELSLKMEGPSIMVKTYPEKLHIILKNLLTNAYKFTSKGGATISWDRCKRNGTEGFYIVVEDTGKSIAKEELPKIFQRFYKGKDSDGRGLGLAIVKELIDVMDGKVDVESNIDEGTRFTITF